MSFLDKIKKQFSKDLDCDAAYYLDKAIIRFQNENRNEWSTAHDDDLKTLRRAWLILKSKSL